MLGALGGTFSLSLGDKGLVIGDQAGMSWYFNYYWLRDNCTTSFDRQTRERVFDIFQLVTRPKPLAVRIFEGALEISWANEEHHSSYPLSWLLPYGDGRAREDCADLPRRSWFSDHYPMIERFSFNTLTTDQATVASWLRALIVEGIAIVTDMPNSDQGLTNLVRLMGHLRPTFFGEYFDVRTHINPTNLAYTAKALELHTDTPAEEMAPGVQFLHCRANTVEGGQSLFLDGVAVANDLRDEDPEAFRLLTEYSIPFYCEHDTYDSRSRQRVIELDARGAVSGVTISQHMADIFDLPQVVLDDYYPAFCKFGRMLQSDKYLMRFRFTAGECIVFDNHRIVHGRSAYTATSGDRHLRGCYADRGEMRSTYRSIVSASRFK
jgi:gamma-butyrobetaine dioxygenase